jgi:hypothetical protein
VKALSDLKQKFLTMKTLRDATVKELGEFKELLIEKAKEVEELLKEVEELKSRVSTSDSSQAITPADRADALEQGISDLMIKVKIDIMRLILNGMDLSVPVDTEANSQLVAVDFFEKRCLHTPTSIPTPRSPATLHCSGLKIWSRSRRTSSRP